MICLISFNYDGLRVLFGSTEAIVKELCSAGIFASAQVSEPN